MSKKLNIAVLFGGNSSEREISLVSGNGVFDALKTFDDFNVFKFDIKYDLEEFVQKSNEIDIAFPVLHGKGGEDGSIQGLCELLNLPYVGSGIQASANAMNKNTSKLIFRSVGVNVANDIYVENGIIKEFLVHKNIYMTHKYEALNAEKGICGNKCKEMDIDELLNFIEEFIKIPCVVKPASEGSSVGVFIVHKKSELENAIKKSIEIGGNIIIEEFLNGTEITVGVIGDTQLDALEPIEIIAEKGEFYDFESKYAEGGSTHILPARISKELTEKAKENAITAHKILGCKHLSRTDMIVVGDNIYVLETNTIPGFTPTSLLPEAVKHSGISYEEFCRKLVILAKNN